MKVRVNLEIWAIYALRDKNFVTVHEVARMLGISPKTAGKLLARLARIGFVEKWSRRAYRVKHEAIASAISGGQGS